RGEHGRPVLLRRIVRVRNAGLGILGRPLPGAGRTLRQLPFVFEQRLEEIIVPLRRRPRPCDFEATADRIATLAGTELALPAEALVFDLGPFRRRANERGVARPMSLAERMTAGDQRDR